MSDIEDKIQLADEYYDNEEYKKAFPLYKEAAEAGDEGAQYVLGGMYDFGEGVKKDLKLAFHWYMKSAEAGNCNAQFCVAVAYELGDGVTKDMLKARRWYEEAAEGGSESAIEWMEENKDTDTDDDNESDFESYQLNLEDENAPWDSSKKAVSEFERALESAYAGDFFDQEIVAEYYIDGKGTKRDYALAAGFFCAALLSGEELGEDISYTNQCAKQLFEQGYGHFALLVANFCHGEMGRTQDYEKAFFWAKVGAELGHADCMYYCSHMYKAGDGVDKDLEQAVYWMRKSAESGYEKAIDWLSDIEEEASYNAGADAIRAHMEACEQGDGHRALAHLKNVFKLTDDPQLLYFANHLMGNIYSGGLFGVPFNYELGEKYHKAAEEIRTKYGLDPMPQK